MVVVTVIFFVFQNFLDRCRKNVQYSAMIDDLKRIRRVIVLATKPTAWRAILGHIWFGLKVVFQAGENLPVGQTVKSGHVTRNYHRTIKEPSSYGI